MTWPICAAACPDSASKSSYTLAGAKIGESPALGDRNVKVAESSWNDEFALVGIDAGPDADGPEPGCAAYGACVLIQPNASPDAVLWVVHD
ncbi:hypothetical protein [Mycolicibacterium aichiense]|uniref:hypothetical protein n=1 Tax=Mycolicibacterium aichiense TaxID=1799 RepID=UPI000E1B55C4|nr:hypothetical protein [Mycolicibacterium aichiense]MCV7017285.1 hypothetical protein [Mycolicibacterium aichiense]